jgi:hypothetical protein
LFEIFPMFNRFSDLMVSRGIRSVAGWLYADISGGEVAGGGNGKRDAAKDERFPRQYRL